MKTKYCSIVYIINLFSKKNAALPFREKHKVRNYIIALNWRRRFNLFSPCFPSPRCSRDELGKHKRITILGRNTQGFQDVPSRLYSYLTLRLPFSFCSADTMSLPVNFVRSSKLNLTMGVILHSCPCPLLIGFCYSIDDRMHLKQRLGS